MQHRSCASMRPRRTYIPVSKKADYLLVAGLSINGKSKET